MITARMRFIYKYSVWCAHSNMVTTVQQHQSDVCVAESVLIQYCHMDIMKTFLLQHCHMGVKKTFFLNVTRGAGICLKDPACMLAVALATSSFTFTRMLIKSHLKMVRHQTPSHEKLHCTKHSGVGCTPCYQTLLRKAWWEGNKFDKWHYRFKAYLSRARTNAVIYQDPWVLLL